MIMAMAKQMYATVSDSRDEEFAGECWLTKSFPPPQQLHLQKDTGEFTERLAKFVTFSS